MKITESVFRGHRNLSVRKPQTMSPARIRDFTDKTLIIPSSNFSARNDKYGIVCQSYFKVHGRITVMQHKTNKSVGLQIKKDKLQVSFQLRG